MYHIFKLLDIKNDYYVARWPPLYPWNDQNNQQNYARLRNEELSDK